MQAARNTAELLQWISDRRASAVVLPPAAPPLPPKEALSQVQAKAKVERSVVPDAERIRKLPTWTEEDFRDLDLTERFRTPNGKMRLRPLQSLALHWITTQKGLVGMLGTGAGKTIVSLLAATALGAQRPMLMIPPTMQIPLREEIERLRHHWRIPKDLFIVPYSQLSVAGSTDLLDRLRPDLIISDECFPYDTEVLTDVGRVRIGDIVEVGVGSSVLAYDKTAGRTEWKPIVRRLRKKLSKVLVRVVHEQGTVVCTADHKVWTESRGYVKAQDLNSDDYVLEVRKDTRGVEQVRRQYSDVVLRELQSPDAAPLPRLRGDARAPTVSGGTPDLWEEGMQERVCCGEDGRCAPSNNDEGTEDVQRLWGGLSSCGVGASRVEAEDLFSGVHGEAAEQRGNGSERGTAEEGVRPLHRHEDVPLLQQGVSSPEEGKEDTSILFRPVLAQALQDDPGVRPAAPEHADSSRFAGEQGANTGHSCVEDTPPGEHLHSLRESVYLSIHRGAERETEVLLPYLQSARERYEGRADVEGHSSARRRAQNAGEQPDAGSGSSREDESSAARSDISCSGRKRSTHEAPVDACRSPGPREHGVPRAYGGCEGTVQVLTEQLRRGLGGTSRETCDRSRRQLTQDETVEVLGQTENFSTQRSRVVRVEILEQGSADGPSWSPGEDPVVYDLEIADHHNYTANGVVVSNCHSVANPTAARSKRVLRYFRSFPETRFVALSGTLTGKSLRDYGHLSELALRHGSPLPLDTADLLAWAACVDSESRITDRNLPKEGDWRTFASFCNLLHIDDIDTRRDEARKVFHDRLRATPGVVASKEGSVGCSLLIIKRDVHVPEVVAEALKELRKTWTRPDGEELVSALDLHRCSMEMSQGFFLRWKWPGGVVDHEWMTKRAFWHREVRAILHQNRVGLDSPLLVTRAVQRVSGIERLAAEGGGHHAGDERLPPSIFAAWDDWSEVKDRPKPPTEVVWLDTFLVEDALKWRKTHPDGIIWFSSRATEEALRVCGERVYGAGENPPVDGKGICLSISSHGTGLNLQKWNENLILSWPSSGKICEQLVSRTHRYGQEADEVNVWHYAHTVDARLAVKKSREDASYIESTTGSSQKLNFCTWLGS